MIWISILEWILKRKCGKLIESIFCCAACDTTTFPVYQNDLINLTEMDCNSSGTLLPYARAEPFGISWADDNPMNCSILSLTIAIQAGASCAGTFGSTSLNNYTTPSQYRFPYENEYDEDCDCSVPDSPLQVCHLTEMRKYLTNIYIFNFQNLILTLLSKVMSVSWLLQVSIGNTLLHAIPQSSTLRSRHAYFVVWFASVALQHGKDFWLLFLFHMIVRNKLRYRAVDC